ncbi:hypothetical protein [Sedimentibacter saalensis]|uniref:hypothetical protein n=1 Tax=Sedimentibacter saalensis TaxID=130788 RepID=UPI0011A71907|nr:hypothetical protein [Sedimentibacter saalensis]
MTCIWQCSNYIKNGKDARKGTVIDDECVSMININKPTIVKEKTKDDKKYYSYISKSEHN